VEARKVEGARAEQGRTVRGSEPGGHSSGRGGRRLPSRIVSRLFCELLHLAGLAIR
jgi:hypothetical protein